MSSGRRRTTERHYSAEEQALGQISKEAEERIQAHRQARTEAREIRLREIERQQKEEEDRQKAQQPGSDAKSASSYSGSRRGSNDSTESDVSSKDSRDPKDQVRNIKTQLRELEEKYKAAMVTNAQLDNTKTSQVFQLELLKEQLEEQEEGMIETQREYKDKCREYELLKRDFENLKLECDGIRQHIELKDKLLKESGLVIITTEEGEFSLTKCSNMSDVPTPELGTAIISEEAANLLKKAGEGTLGKSLSNEKSSVSQKAVSDTDVVYDAKGNDKSDLVEGKIDINKTDTHSNIETDPVVDSKVTEEHINVESKDGEKKTISIENQQNINNSVVDKVENENVGLEITEGEAVCEGEKEKSKSEGMVREKVDTGSESDESEVFYESKSEVSPREHERPLEPMEDVGKGAIAPVEIQKELGKDEVDVDSEENENGKYMENEKHIGDENNDNDRNLSVKDVVNGKTDSENGIMKDGSSDNVRKILGSESFVSMESDVTYHSESEDIDLLMEPGLGENENDLCVPETVVQERKNDFVEEEVLLVDAAKSNDNESAVESIETVDEGEKIEVIEAGSEFNVNCREIFNDRDAEPTHETKESPHVGADLIRDKDTLKEVVDSSAVEYKSENEECSSGIGSENVSIESDLIEKKGPDHEVCSPVNDEVFMSVPVTENGNDQSMVDFAKGYVIDVVLKSVDLYNKQLKDEEVMVRQKSYTSETVDICIPKSHYSEELVDTASDVIPKKLSSGSVEILSPVVHLPSENKGDLKFFSYKVDTDADVVLTSIEEEKNPLEGIVNVETPQSPISGFGICYSGLEGHSDLDSENDESDSDNAGEDLGTGSMIPEVFSMSVAVSGKVDESSKESVDKDSKISSSISVEDRNVAQSSSGIKNDTESFDELGVDAGLLKQSADDGEGEKTQDTSVEVEVESSGHVDSEVGDARDAEAMENEKSPAESAVGFVNEKGDKSQINTAEEEGARLSEGDSETGSRLSGELSPNEESVKGAEAGNMSRKKSKKKGSKKNSKDECVMS